MATISIFAPFYQDQTEQTRRYAELFYSGMERINQLFLSIAQQAFHEQLQLMQSLMTVRDLQQAVAMELQALTKVPHLALGFQQELLAVLNEMQNGMTNVAQNNPKQSSYTVEAAPREQTKAAQEAARELKNAAAIPSAHFFDIWKSMIWDPMYRDLAKSTAESIAVKPSAAINPGGTENATARDRGTSHIRDRRVSRTRDRRASRSSSGSRSAVH